MVQLMVHPSWQWFCQRPQPQICHPSLMGDYICLKSSHLSMMLTLCSLKIFSRPRLHQILVALLCSMWLASHLSPGLSEKTEGWTAAAPGERLDEGPSSGLGHLCPARSLWSARSVRRERAHLSASRSRSSETRSRPAPASSASGPPWRTSGRSSSS